ncbi:MAG: hydrogen peroxide-inducible genes activator [Bacteroidia bacterium]
MLNISLIQIQYLIALDEHRNFIKAAEASFVTQPTLSMQIKKLEEELGVMLFDRSKHPIQPTTIGKRIIEQARLIFQETAHVENILKEFTGEISGTLRVGILPTISNSLVPKLIGQISRHYPDLKLHINEMLTSEIIDDLKVNKLDVGIVSTPLHDDSIIEKALYVEKFRIYLHPSHPAYSKKALEVDDLLKDKIWLLSEGNCFRTQTLNLCTLPDESLNHLALNYESGSLQTLKKVVDQEGGATIMPEWEAAELDDESLNNVRALRSDNAGREVGLIYTKYYAKEGVINKLEEMILKTLPVFVIENKDLEIIEM